MVSSLFVFQRPGRDKGTSSTTTTTTTTTTATPRRRRTRSSVAVEAAVSFMSQIEDTLRGLFFHHNILLAVAAVSLALVAEYCWYWHEVAYSRDFARGAGEEEGGRRW